MRRIYFALLFILVLLLDLAPLYAQGRIKAVYQFPDVSIKEFQNHYLPGSVVNDRNVLLGSVGSDLWRGAKDDAREFWMITDSGPNGVVKVNGKNRRTFWVPEFNPTIIHVKADGKSLRIIDALPIVGRSGKPVTGLPNLRDLDETPYDYSAQSTVDFNVNGLDTEGLVRTKAGEFWLVEEYRPSLVRLDKTGKVVKRYVPQGVQLAGTDYDVVGALPAIFARRKINRGFEGIALSADEKLLYVVLQSPLRNPDLQTANASRNTRVLVFDTQKEQVVGEYVYRFEAANEFDPAAGAAPEAMKLSGVVALNPTTLLILERTDRVAKLFTVDLSRASNILYTHWDDPTIAPTLEAVTDLAPTGVQALAKTQVLDLGRFKEIPEKIEGVAVIDRNTVAVSNDNEFAIDEGKYDQQGNNVGHRHVSQLLVIALDKPLPLPTLPPVQVASDRRKARLVIARKQLSAGGIRSGRDPGEMKSPRL